LHTPVKQWPLPASVLSAFCGACLIVVHVFVFKMNNKIPQTYTNNRATQKITGSVGLNGNDALQKLTNQIKTVNFDS
jgi:hypothetical protein